MRAGGVERSVELKERKKDLLDLLFKLPGRSVELCGAAVSAGEVRRGDVEAREEAVSDTKDAAQATDKGAQDDEVGEGQAGERGPYPFC